MTVLRHLVIIYNQQNREYDPAPFIRSSAAFAMKRKADTVDCFDCLDRANSTFPATKRMRLDQQQNYLNNIFLLLPDNVLALVLSECYVFRDDDSWRCFDIFKPFDTQQRLVCQQFRRVIDDTVPCFAMLKLLMSEYDRVYSVNDNTDTHSRDQESPWLTSTEVSMITSKRLIDLNEPLPSPHLMPLTALQIVASTVLTEAWHMKQLDEWFGSDRKPTCWLGVELIYSMSGMGVFIQTINDEKSPINGKQITVQQVTTKDTTECGCCYTPELTSRIMVEDTEAAKLLGIAPNTVYDRDTFPRIATEPTSDMYRTRDIMNYGAILDSYFIRDVTGYNEDDLTQLQPNLHYRRNKSLWDQLPTLPPAVYQLLTSNAKEFELTENSDSCRSGLVALIRAIRSFKLNVIFKSQTSRLLRQLYNGRIESGNVEYLIDKASIFSPCINSVAFPDGVVKFVSTERFQISAEGIVADGWGRDVSAGFSAALQSMANVDLPVPITPIDFARMIHILVGNRPADFNTSLELGLNTQYFRVHSSIFECQIRYGESAPLGTELYSEYDSTLQQTLHYNARFTRTCQAGYFTDAMVLQLLRKQDQILFRLRCWLHYGREPSHLTEIIKPYDLTIAKDLFEYWLGYVTSSGNWKLCPSVAEANKKSTYKELFPDFDWESSSQ